MYVWEIRLRCVISAKETNKQDKQSLFKLDYVAQNHSISDMNFELQI